MSDQPAKGQVRVTLVRSTAGHLRNIADSVKGLGLRRMHQSAVLKDTPEVRGLINCARHLLRVEEAR